MADETPRLLSLNEVCRLTTLSRTRINTLRAQGRFPQAVPLSDIRIAFLESEVIAWIHGRVAGRGEGHTTSLGAAARAANARRAKAARQHEAA